MMDVLNWMSHNFLLTIIIGGGAVSILEAIFGAGRRRAWKCPECGHRGAVSKKDD